MVAPIVLLSLHLAVGTLALADAAPSGAQIAIDGSLVEPVWSSPAVTRSPFASGSLMAFRDGATIYVGLDVTLDTHDDGPANLGYPPKGDGFALIIDSNSDGRVDIADVAYAPAPNSLTQVSHYTCHVCRPQDIKYSASNAKLAGGFASSANGATAHRTWEMAIPISELPNASPHVWVQVRSENPPINFEQFPPFDSPGVLLVGASQPLASQPPAGRAPALTASIVRVRSDGTIEVKHADGSKHERLGNTESFSNARGNTGTSSAVEAVAPDPPMAPPQVKTFLDGHNQELRDMLLLLLGGDQASLGNYLRFEQKQNLSLYGQIRSRTAAINFVVRSH